MGSYEIHTEERNAHWVGWITRTGETKPFRAVLVVAASQQEAEARAKAWADQASD